MDDALHIPEEIISLILPRIRPKDLNRFKGVCKLWKSLISDPKFVKSCLTHTQPELLFQANGANGTANGLCYQIFSANILEEDVKVEKLVVPLVIDSFMRDRLILLSSCDGLLLLQNSQDLRILHVYNPTTGQYKNLPRLECGSSKSALIFDDSIGKYKVFGLASNEFSCPVILTLVLETDCHWNELEVSDYVEFGSASQLILVGKELHFVIVDDETCEFFIYSINIAEGDLRKTKFPEELIKDEYYHSLSQVKGSLCVTIAYEFELEMWVLDDRVKSSWTKYFEINLKSLRKKPTYIPMKSKKKKQKPPIFESFLYKDTLLFAAGGIGKDFSNVVRVILHDNNQLFMYDLKSQELREIGALDNKLKLCDFDSVLHTNSLVSWDERP